MLVTVNTQSQLLAAISFCAFLLVKQFR